jgi:hypothetical protein
MLLRCAITHLLVQRSLQLTPWSTYALQAWQDIVSTARLFVTIVAKRQRMN